MARSLTCGFWLFGVLLVGCSPSAIAAQEKKNEDQAQGAGAANQGRPT